MVKLYDSSHIDRANELIEWGMSLDDAWDMVKKYVPPKYDTKQDDA